MTTNKCSEKKSIGFNKNKSNLINDLFLLEIPPSSRSIWMWGLKHRFLPKVWRIEMKAGVMS